MHESFKIEETILQNNQRMPWNGVLRLWKNKLFGKYNQNKFKYGVKKEIGANMNKTSVENSEVTTNIKKDNDIFPCEYSNNIPGRDQYANIYELDKYKHLQFQQISKSTMQKKIIQLIRRRKTKELDLHEKQLTPQSLFENMELARKLSDERITRAKNYYKKLLSYVKLCALNEIVEYIVTNFDFSDINLLLESASDINFKDNSFNSELYEIYLQTKFKIGKSEESSSNKTSMTIEELKKDNYSTNNTEMISNESFTNINIDPPNRNSELDESMSLLRSTQSNFQLASEYLMSRICNVSLEINKTAIDCLKKEILDPKTGKYLGRNGKVI